MKLEGEVEIEVEVEEVVVEVGEQEEVGVDLVDAVVVESVM